MQWKSEPNRVAWVDASTGYPCLIRRARAGFLCGYVAVPPSHPWFERGYSDEPVYNVEVHGGLTYAAHCDGDEGNGICHRPEPGSPDNVWWFGFECDHAFDLVPRDYEEGFAIQGDIYRDIQYVTKEVRSLADQLAEVK
jgi:hypothetical protein